MLCMVCSSEKGVQLSQSLMVAGRECMQAVAGRHGACVLCIQVEYIML